MLSPFAEPYYPPMENFVRRTEITETNDEKITEDNIATKEDTKDIQKHQDNIESVKSTSINAEWIQVNNGKKKINVRHKESKENHQCEENNQYGIL